MRFLGIGQDGSLGDMYLALSRGGNEVKAYIGDQKWHGILGGMINRVDHWRQELDWIRQEDGILIFEAADCGVLQDELRREGFNVIGGCAVGDRMEADRDFGQHCMREAGMTTAPSKEFTSFSQALDFITNRPRRYVFKLSGSGYASSCNVVGDLEDGSDIAASLSRYNESWTFDEPPKFILMDHLSGVEVGVGGYFNGEAFLEPVVMDWEHKRFFPGDMGELTGEMGTLLTYRNAGALFQATLAKMAEQLRSYGYVGYININTIVNQTGVWPLEFTCRFGYPGAAICSTLHTEGWDTLFTRMIQRDRLDFPTRDGFAAGVMLTVPPFPQCNDYSEISKGLPIQFREPLTEEDFQHFHLSEVESRDGRLITTGGTGSLMAVTGTGATATAACEAAYKRCANVVVPNLRYRNDIGAKFISRDQKLMQTWGLWPAEEAAAGCS